MRVGSGTGEGEDTLRARPNPGGVTRAAVWGCLAVVLAATVLVPVAAGTPAPVAGASTPAAGTSLPAADAPAAVAQRAPAAPANNSTTQHERPSNAGGDGNAAAVRRWLGGRLGSLLEQSSIQLTQGQYETADRLLGEQYEDYLGKYAEVAGPTADNNTRAARVLADAQTHQQRYVSLVARYQATYDDYQAAKTAGNETRARRLARRLHRFHDRLTRTSNALTRELAAAGNLTATNLTASQRRINRTTANISRIQANVTAATLVRTQLTVLAAARQGSYADPVWVRGRLAPQGDAGLPDRVALLVHDRVRTVDLGPDGTFNATFRPTTIRTGPQPIDVRYLPANASVFLGANATVNATIDAVQPTLQVAAPNESVRYGTPLNVSGRVAVAGAGVGGVPVALRLGNVSLGTVVTNPDGSFRATTTVPVSVAAGTRTLTARVAQENRAIARGTASTPVAVETAATSLSLAAPRAGDGSVRLAGQLTTADGTPVAGARVVVTRNGTVLASVTTDAAGRYAVRVEQPAAPAVVQARFDGRSSHLAASSATTRVAGTGGQGAGGSIPTVRPWVLGLLVAGALLMVGGYTYDWWTPGGDPAAATADPQGDAEATDAAASEPASAGGEPAVSVAAFADREPSPENVAALYGVVRRALAGGSAGGLTHWEFYRERAASLGERAEALRELTATYERAAYAEAGVAAEEWERARAAADRLVDRTGFAGEAENGD